MWLSVEADAKSSACSVTSEDRRSSAGKQSSGNHSSQMSRTRANSVFHGSVLDSVPGDRLDSSSGCDVMNTDSDSGAIDASVVSVSREECVATGTQCPDGGYGWVVVLASFLNAFIIDGVGSCYGLVYPHVMEKYGASAWVASLAGSLFNALLVMGSVSVMLVKRFGYRRVTMSGGVLACLSCVLSTRSPNIVCFVLSYGLFTGCACGLVFLPSIVIVNSYFHKKRGLANGIITSGSGAGLLVLAQLVNYLLEEFPLDGALLVVAGVLLNTCVFSCVYRPPGHEPASSAVEAGDEDKPMLQTPGSGSTDSGLLMSPSQSPSMVTLATVGDDPHESWAEGYKGNVEELEDEENTSLGQPCWGVVENNGDKDKSTACSGLNQKSCENEPQGCSVGQSTLDVRNRNSDEYTVLDPSGINDQLSHHETASLACLCAVHNPQSHEFNVIEQNQKEQSKEIPTTSFVRLQKSDILYQPSQPSCSSHQFWMSAHDIPAQPAAWRQDTMHASAYDVTHWGFTDVRRNKAPRGLVPLAERFSFLKNVRYLEHSTSCHDHRQTSQWQGAPGQQAHHGGNPSCSCYLQHNGDRTHDHVRSRPPQHTHPASRLSWLDQGSNLYLTGSISTLKSLQAKHIQHLTTSQFSSPEAPLVPHHRGSKPHLSQGSVALLSSSTKSHASEYELNFPRPLTVPGQENISGDIIPNLPISVGHNSSFYNIANKDDQSQLLLFSSKQSEDPLLSQTIIGSNLSICKRSRHLDEELDFGTVNLKETSQESLPVITSGYSLRQLLRMPCFHLFCIGSCLIQIGYPIPSIFLADLAYHQGFSTADTTVIMGVMGGLNIAGRLLSGLLANLGVRPLRLLYLSLVLGGLACLLAPLYTTLWSLVLFAGLFGFLLGAFPPVQPLVIVEYFGLDSLASVFGLLTSIKGASSMLGPPLAGLVYDASGQYPMSFVFGGVVFLLSAAVHLAMPLFRPRGTHQGVEL